MTADSTGLPLSSKTMILPRMACTLRIDRKSTRSSTVRRSKAEANSRLMWYNKSNEARVVSVSLYSWLMLYPKHPRLVLQVHSIAHYQGAANEGLWDSTTA